ncbi:uncharacterized protein [Aristolochia californica]|uniref:uncharacterized protein isoform X2 n=1 Tax=Aristolochia californica TaxID=171875 RepID=UPI0035E32589
MEREVRNQQQRGDGGCTGGAQVEPDFFLQWGNRKRLRCVKVQVKDDGTEKTTVRVGRRVVRADKDSNLILRHPSPHRVLRNSESSAAMKGQSNGIRGGSPESAEVRVHNNHNGDAGGSGSSETGQDKKGTGSSSGSEATVWPKFTIALTNKEKEEDFWAIKGSKLPQRPKKRSKFIQRTLNYESVKGLYFERGVSIDPYLHVTREGPDFACISRMAFLICGGSYIIQEGRLGLVSPGTWLCDLTLERYEVREKKISKKRPRGLKAMGNMESDSEQIEKKECF